MSVRVIAIDGPGGSGKTSVSRAVAQRLELPHLDTGAYYRAATLHVLRQGIDPDDAKGVAACMESVGMDYVGGRMRLGGGDVSEEIRSDAVTAAVSAVSAVPEVRARLVDLQREWVDCRGGSAVVEGRDIGTAVFPDAALKIYLTARPEVRARRRAAELPRQADVSSVEQELARRDRFDSGRTASPLHQAEDAVAVDTSDMSMDEVIERISELALAVLEES